MLLLHFTGRIFVFLLLGCTSAVMRGPSSVHGWVGRTLSVTCLYDKSYEAYYKYWCRGHNWDSCTKVVKTDGSEAEVKNDRTSIKDNHTCSCFTVTLENLREADAGKYWCAIEKAGYDIHDQVTVHTEHLPPTTTIVVTTGYSSTVHVPTSRLDENTKWLILPAVLLVLVLVLLVGGLLVMCRLKKKKATKASGHTLLTMSSSYTENNVSNATIAANIRPSYKTPSPSSDQDGNSTLHMEYASVKRTPDLLSPPEVPSVPSTNTEDISYVTINFPAQDEQAVYANL